MRLRIGSGFCVVTIDGALFAEAPGVVPPLPSCPDPFDPQQ
jgi:hypothetical protein